jgi:cation transport ATPase
VSASGNYPENHRQNDPAQQQRPSGQHGQDADKARDHEKSGGGHGTSRMYLKFALILLVSLAVMWVLSMSMVRTIDHFYFNLSNFWMALLMVSAMAIVMTIGMWSMFKNRTANIAMLAGFAVMFAAVFALGRTETFIGNEQFLKSMIPHHSRALLVCQESTITDPEIIELCESIVKSQQEEISQMKAILDRYDAD